jgi:hypothetical protein
MIEWCRLCSPPPAAAGKVVRPGRGGKANLGALVPRAKQARSPVRPGRLVHWPAGWRGVLGVIREGNGADLG